MTAESLTIRPLEARDISACVVLYQEAYAAPPYGDGWSDATCERIIRDLLRLFPKECFVAERAREVLGFILCSSLAGLRATVEEFAVRPRHQQQGVGRALLEHMVSRYRAQGLPFLELVANVRAPAYGFYSREGFEETGNYRLMSKQL